MGGESGKLTLSDDENLRKIQNENSDSLIKINQLYIINTKSHESWIIWVVI